MRRFSEAEKQTIWDLREAGVPVRRIARHLGRQAPIRSGCSLPMPAGPTAARAFRTADKKGIYLIPSGLRRTTRW